MEHNTHLAASHAGMLRATQATDRLAVEYVVTLIGRIEQAEDVKECGFTTATRPHDGNKFAYFNL